MASPEETLRFKDLPVEIYPSNEALGQAAAMKAAEVLVKAISLKGHANLILATGNSMLTFLKALSVNQLVHWRQVNVFHMDEYAGMPAGHPASFRRFLQEKIIAIVQPHTFHGIVGEAPYSQTECQRYEALLRANPPDLCCLGIGENGHLAFNDPPFADFNDPVWVKIISLDEKSRRQQVGEGHFQNLDDVPRQAITMTIPALLAAPHLLVIVPERRKAEAVKEALTGPITQKCPASILRRTSHAVLMLDRDSASLLREHLPVDL